MLEAFLLMALVEAARFVFTTLAVTIGVVVGGVTLGKFFGD